MSDAPRLSVVVPTLDEAERLPLLLADLEPLDAEVVVVDGGSTDGTQETARRHGARVVTAGAGRGRQLRRGARKARGEWLAFLHADSRLDVKAVQALRDFVRSEPGDRFAHFRFQLDGDRPFHRFIETGQAIRERLLGLVYGDQGLVVSRSLYDLAGGYPEWPVMEDVEMVRRLEAHGRRVALPASLRTSPRRYDEEGGVGRWLRNVALMTLFRLGVPPEILSRGYRPRRSQRPGTETHRRTRRAVGVFAKAPVPGKVKTRLAADLGDARATRIYRALGRSTVDVLRDGPWRVVVFVDPPHDDALEAVGTWLGADLELRPQAEGDLGRRMSEAFDELLDEVEAVALVGTDLPDLEASTVEEAFQRLADHDVAIGPATDGGYYLIAASRPHPRLFADMEWSHPRVLRRTLERAAAEGLDVALLTPHTDVDTVADLPPELAAGGRGRA